MPAPVERPKEEHTRLIPSAPDYETVGEFYGILRSSLEEFVNAKGQAAFRTDTFQVEGTMVNAPSLVVVRNLEDAVLAIDRIVEQGEGASNHHDQSHFSRFSCMLDELLRLKAARPEFEPSRRVGINPVLRSPQAAERTQLTSPQAIVCADAFNAVYWLMLRTLSALYLAGASHLASCLVKTMLDCMHLMADLAINLTEIPASDDAPHLMAGPSFTIYRHAEGAATASSAISLLRERATELAIVAGTLPLGKQAATHLAAKLQGIAEDLRHSV